MNITIRVFDKTFEFGPYEKLHIDGHTMYGDEEKILEFTTYEGGYCETCRYSTSGVRFSDDITKKIWNKKKITYYDEVIELSHADISIS